MACSNFLAFVEHKVARYCDHLRPSQHWKIWTSSRVFFFNRVFVLSFIMVDTADLQLISIQRFFFKFLIYNFISSNRQIWNCKSVCCLWLFQYVITFEICSFDTLMYLNLDVSHLLYSNSFRLPHARFVINWYSSKIVFQH